MQAAFITPTHNPKWLHETYQSLERQSIGDWEWVIVPNRGAEIPSHISRDARVRVIPAPDDCTTIGALKRFGFEAAKSELLIELDHDDLLADNCLLQLLRAHEHRVGDFYYSDFVNFHENGASKTYGENNGWTYYPTTRDGHEYTACAAFDCHAPSMLLHITTAPNHVRAWTRDAYEAAGGHDPKLDVCDDYDLICRTYLAGQRFYRVAEPLYWYREHGKGNTYQQRLDVIAKLSQELSNRYFYRIVNHWAESSGLLRVDLYFHGREPHQPPEGYTAATLSHSLPFGDNSVAVLRAYDLLHLYSPYWAVQLLNEAHRVLIPGGWLLTSAPSTNSAAGFAHPCARSHWNQLSWRYFTQLEYAREVAGLTARFMGSRIWEEFPTPMHRQRDEKLVYADLCALKGQRQPGVDHWTRKEAAHAKVHTRTARIQTAALPE